MTQKQAEKKIRILVAKPGLDGHDRGALVLCRAFRDAGMEVIYTGFLATPEQVAQMAIDEDVDVVAMSLLNGAHLTAFPKVAKLIRQRGASEILLVGGGIIPEEDKPLLEKQGITGNYGPGTPLKTIIEHVEETLKSFLREDLGYGDITTDSLIDPSTKASATIVCNDPAVIAGLWEAQALLEIAGCEATLTVKEGNKVVAGSRILKATGPAGSLLKVERTLLNLLSHMSGVATATSELVKLAEKSGRSDVRIACTRKTLPGLRYFEKRAVAVAGEILTG